MISSSRAWIETFSGGQLHILDPRQEEISIIDIAHGLSQLCRFTGQCRKFYSVAEHAYHVSYLVPEEDALWGLSHDDSEAYISDLNSPLKNFTEAGPAYRKIEAKIMRAICRKFGLDPVQPTSVHDADMAMLWAEKEQLMSPLKWGDKGKSASVRIQCWAPEVAEKMYLERFNELTKKEKYSGDTRSTV